MATSEQSFCYATALSAVLWACASNMPAVRTEASEAEVEAAVEAAVATLPPGIAAVWDVERAYHESTPTREQICINGLWRWQPAGEQRRDIPDGSWGHFKVPGCWPGITDYMQKDCQSVFAHPDWADQRLGGIGAAWYQRQITIPRHWSGRRIVVRAEYVNSFAVVYLDGRPVGEIRFPAGEVELTAACDPGSAHILTLLVEAMPLEAVMLSYSDTASARQVQGRVNRRGLCGDVFLVSVPAGPRIEDVQIDTSVREGRVKLEVVCGALTDDANYSLRARVSDGPEIVETFASDAFTKGQLKEERLSFSHAWKPDKLWDVDTPENMYQIQLSLCDAQGQELDTSFPARFGFREFWIDGRDFYLNGTRIFFSSVPLDNAQVGAAWATYEAARESMRRLQSFGINFVYTHNYGCEPGSHLSFAEILRAADDVGMLVAFSQPHFGHYEWDAPDAETTNGYAQHAAFFVQVARNHPSVVAYATSHNATGYAEDMNPDMIDGIQAARSQWSQKNVERAERVEAIIRRLDPSRIVYHHASGNLGAMHTSNFYTNFVPVQEMSDWFEHWATVGVKPLFTCEYSVPMSWDWTMYRGWYQGRREFGSARVPWEFCLAQWNAQFLGDSAFAISAQEAENLRWEARQFEAGREWHRWDYPYAVGSSDFAERYPIYARYFAENWPAFRTWGVSANSPWDHGHYWTLRDGVQRQRKDLAVDWPDLQKPGFSPDYLDERYERVDLAYEMSDWIPTVAAQALIRTNRPLLAYLAGKPEAFTSKDHNYLPGQACVKQLIVINNSRRRVSAACQWTLELPDVIAGRREIAVAAGEQERIELRFELPPALASGSYRLRATVAFSTGERQEDSFMVHVLAPAATKKLAARIALFDPVGQTRKLLDEMDVHYATVDVDADLSGYDVLVIGQKSLTPECPAPDIERVRDGLKVLLFEQTPEVLEQRFGFRVATYGLRTVFKRVPDHPILAGVEDEHLRDWRGESTIVPPRLAYRLSPEFGYAPTVRWCGIPVSRLWRCGNRGNVATVLIEKPHRGDFLPILDGGFSLQYSPLLQYREGAGMVLFCQLDVTGRTESDPVAAILAQQIVQHVTNWQPSPSRSLVYAGDAAGRQQLEVLGLTPAQYVSGELADDALLVVGPKGGEQLAKDVNHLADWLSRGGRLLLWELDMAEANALLPTPVAMRREEHIATTFAAPGAASPLAGIGPADVFNPAPRQLPLLTGPGAIGNGVLGALHQQQIVFCQYSPLGLPDVAGQYNLRRAYRRTSFLLTRLLANLGVAATTPVLERFASPVRNESGNSLVRNGDFRQDAEGDDVAGEWVFSGSRGATGSRVVQDGDAKSNVVVLLSPPAGAEDRATAMLAQHQLPLQKGQWYRISVDSRRGDTPVNVNVTIMNTSSWRSLFDYQQFEPGPTWRTFSFDVQATETVEDNTRLQIWFEGPGEIQLANVRITPVSDPAVGRWLEGSYVDTPEAWDDPYRFFRW